ncbi:uncharacterized protein LOC131303083 [Rhododendron vialii]|uniref:uncharacterized protein LOC131303083 n=1 Tax=Rhododendron vialii TaxID=182163 RepID=UPI00265D7987|nr:uncharacterized protein LOC131303083 [Rhododendron vialii]
MCVGGVVAKTPDAAWDYFEELAEKIQNWDCSDPSKRNVVNPVPSSSKKFQLSEQSDLAHKVTQLFHQIKTLQLHKVTGAAFVAKVEEICVLCEIAGHATGDCQMLPAVMDIFQGTGRTEFNAVNQQLDPYSQTFSPVWKMHPNFQWSNPQPPRPPQVPPPQQHQAFRPPQSQRALKFSQHQQPPGESFQLNPQGQNYVASSSVLSLEKAKSITTLRNGKEVDKAIPPKLIKPLVKPIVLQASVPPIDSPTSEPSPVGEHPKSSQVEEPKAPVSQILAPFPQRLKAPAHANTNVEIYELFKQVRINIPLVDAVKQIPTYAKFLKDLCTQKRKLNVQKKVFLTEQIEKALLDLGTSVNLLPYSIYEQLGLGEMRPTPVTLQLADRSI